MSRNYGLIVAKGKFDVLKTNMPVLRTSNFQWKTIRPIVSRGVFHLPKDSGNSGWVANGT